MAERAAPLVAASRRVDLPAVFGDRGLYLLVSPPCRMPAAGGVQLGTEPEPEPGQEYQLVHVISSWAKGEVRAYALVDGELRLRRPCFTGDWREMDAAVGAALGPSAAAVGR